MGTNRGKEPQRSCKPGWEGEGRPWRRFKGEPPTAVKVTGDWVRFVQLWVTSNAIDRELHHKIAKKKKINFLKCISQQTKFLPVSMARACLGNNLMVGNCNRRAPRKWNRLRFLILNNCDCFYVSRFINVKYNKKEKQKFIIYIYSSSN